MIHMSLKWHCINKCNKNCKKIDFLHQFWFISAHSHPLSYDEFFTIDNQLWLFVHQYVMENWVRIPIFISLVVGSRSDNLTKVIISITNRWWVATRPYCQKTHLFSGKLMLFKAQRLVLQNKSMTTMCLINIQGSIVWPIAPIWPCKLY